MSNGHPAGNELRKALKLLTAATIAVYIALAGLGVIGWIDASNKRTDIEQLAEETNTALCKFRAGLENQVAGSEDFLKENPQGIPGLSAEAIQASIDRQRTTIKSLSDLDC